MDSQTEPLPIMSTTRREQTLHTLHSRQSCGGGFARSALGSNGTEWKRSPPWVVHTVGVAESRRNEKPVRDRRQLLVDLAYVLGC